MEYEDNSNALDFVRITPIISRHNNTIMAEPGAGGVQDDFAYTRDILLGDAATIAKLVTLCVKELQGQPEVMNRVVGMLTSCVEKGISVLSLRGSELGEDAKLSSDEGFDDVDDPPRERLVPALVHLATHGQMQHGAVGVSNDTVLRRADGLPKQIVSPPDFSRPRSLTDILDFPFLAPLVLR